MFNRRQFLTAAAGFGVLTVVPVQVRALDVLTYGPEELQRLQANGKPFLIDFFATWCTTCAAQERVLETLTSESAAYKAIPILRVDWDMYGDGELSRSLAIPRRSTLVMMKGTTELGRLVADTRQDKIAALLDLAS